MGDKFQAYLLISVISVYSVVHELNARRQLGKKTWPYTLRPPALR